MASSPSPSKTVRAVLRTGVLFHGLRYFEAPKNNGYPPLDNRNLRVVLKQTDYDTGFIPQQLHNSFLELQGVLNELSPLKSSPLNTSANGVSELKVKLVGRKPLFYTLGDFAPVALDADAAESAFTTFKRVTFKVGVVGTVHVEALTPLSLLARAQADLVVHTNSDRKCLDGQPYKNVSLEVTQLLFLPNEPTDTNVAALQFDFPDLPTPQPVSPATNANAITTNNKRKATDSPTALPTTVTLTADEARFLAFRLNLRHDDSDLDRLLRLHRMLLQCPEPTDN